MRRLAVSAGLFLAAASPALAADPVEGDWLTEPGAGKVRIAPCPGRPERLCGTLFWVKDPAEARSPDVNNPDPGLRKRPLQGLLMLRDLKQAASGRWTGGQIYDPKTGKTFDSKVSANPNGTIKVVGCIMMVCQAQTWKRG